MAQTLDRQIMDYLPLLGTEEKRSILNVIKLFVRLRREQKDYTSVEEYNTELEEAAQLYKAKKPDEKYETEMMRRFQELESGKVKGIALDEVESRARASRKSRRQA